MRVSVRRAWQSGLVLASLSAVLVCAAPALGGERTLSGTIDPSGTVKLKISFDRLPDGTSVRIYRFALRHIPMSCSDGTAAEFEVRSRAKTFNRPGIFRDFFGRGRGSADSDGNREEWSVVGLLQEPGRAVGVVRVRTTDVSGRRDVDCRSGRLSWTAVK